MNGEIKTYTYHRHFQLPLSFTGGVCKAFAMGVYQVSSSWFLPQRSTSKSCRRKILVGIGQTFTLTQKHTKELVQEAGRKLGAPCPAPEQRANLEQSKNHPLLDFGKISDPHLVQSFKDKETEAPRKKHREQGQGFNSEVRLPFPVPRFALTILQTTSGDIESRRYFQTEDFCTHWNKAVRQLGSLELQVRQTYHLLWKVGSYL